MTTAQWLMLAGAALALLPLGLLVTKGIELLNAKAKGAKLESTVALLSEAAKAAVLEVEVTLKPKLVEALKDGVLSDAEKAMLKKAALDLLTSRLPIASLALARDVFGPLLQQVLSKQVETAVVGMKLSGIADQVAPSPLKLTDVVAAPTPPRPPAPLPFEPAP